MLIKFEVDNVFNYHLKKTKIMAKKTWNREEVEELILRVVDDIAHDEELIHHHNGDFRAAQKWIKRNLK